MNRPDALTQGVVDAWRDMTSADKNRLLDSAAGRRLVSACVALEAASRIRLVTD